MHQEYLHLRRSVTGGGCARATKHPSRIAERQDRGARLAPERLRVSIHNSRQRRSRPTASQRVPYCLSDGLLLLAYTWVLQNLELPWFTFNFSPVSRFPPTLTRSLSRNMAHRCSFTTAPLLYLLPSPLLSFPSDRVPAGMEGPISAEAHKRSSHSWGVWRLRRCGSGLKALPSAGFRLRWARA